MDAPAVRDATPDDIPAMFDVRVSVREHALDEAGLAWLGITPASVAGRLRAGGRAWVAEAEGDVVGFSIADAVTGSVWALFVRPGHERRGHGRRLLEAAVDRLWRQGWEAVWLSTGADPGLRANGFYPHLGWVAEGRTPEGENRYVLRRPGRIPPAAHAV